MIKIIAAIPLDDATVRGGSALSNLALEMSPLDDNFRIRLARIYNGWIAAIAGALKRGKTAGHVRADVDVFEFATGLVASYEGFVALAKKAQDSALLQVGIRQMTNTLKALKS
ncbi:MAG: TetR family transcriptional regulator C-terminal domain-containing protein [Asticcacaulis sp.]